MSEAGRSTDNHTQDTALLDDESTVYRSPQKRRRFSSTQQDSNASPLTASAMDPDSKTAPPDSDQTLPSKPVSYLNPVSKESLDGSNNHHFRPNSRRRSLRLVSRYRCSLDYHDAIRPNPASHMSNPLPSGFFDRLQILSTTTVPRSIFGRS